MNNSQKIRFAVVGCGHIGKRHAEMVKREEGAELVALCDIRPQEELGIEMPITDALYQVLFNGKNAKEMVNKLLQRDKKSEIY